MLEGLGRQHLIRAWHSLGPQWGHPSKPGSTTRGTKPAVADSRPSACVPSLFGGQMVKVSLCAEVRDVDLGVIRAQQKYIIERQALVQDGPTEVHCLCSGLLVLCFRHPPGLGWEGQSC